MILQEISPSAELLELQRVAYAVEGELIGDDRIPALSDDLAALLAAGLSWLGAVEDDRLLGAVALLDDDALVDVHRLVVAPEAHRRGIGRALVAAVVTRAGGRRVVVSTGVDNAPARALYEQLGFSWRDDVEVLPSLWVARYELIEPATSGCAHTCCAVAEEPPPRALLCHA